MHCQAMGSPVARGGCAQACPRGAEAFPPETSFFIVSNYSSRRVPLHSSASKCSWRIFNSPSWQFWTHSTARERRKDDFSLERGRVREVRANKLGDHDENHHNEVRVCTNRSCRQLGSLHILEVLRSLAPPSVAVESCGCLGKCGSGPNIVLLPAELVVSHCNTPVHGARLLERQCGAADPETNLKALGLKERGNESFQRGEFEQSEQFYSEAIELNPSGGLHFLYGNRSAVRLARGDLAGALDDAERALCIAPMWAAAHLRRADAYVQIGDFHNAHLACSTALQLDPSLRRSKNFQAKVKQIAEISLSS